MNLPQYPQAFLQFVSMCSTYSWSQYPKRFHSLQTESRSTLIHSKRDYIKNYLSARTKDLIFSKAIPFRMKNCLTFTLEPTPRCTICVTCNCRALSVGGFAPFITSTITVCTAFLIRTTILVAAHIPVILTHARIVL